MIKLSLRTLQPKQIVLFSDLSNTHKITISITIMRYSLMLNVVKRVRNKMIAIVVRIRVATIRRLPVHIKIPIPFKIYQAAFVSRNRQSIMSSTTMPQKA